VFIFLAAYDNGVGPSKSLESESTPWAASSSLDIATLLYSAACDSGVRPGSLESGKLLLLLQMPLSSYTQPAIRRSCQRHHRPNQRPSMRIIQGFVNFVILQSKLISRVTRQAEMSINTSSTPRLLPNKTTAWLLHTRAALTSKVSEQVLPKLFNRRHPHYTEKYRIHFGYTRHMLCHNRQKMESRRLFALCSAHVLNKLSFPLKNYQPPKYLTNQLPVKK
jgi:hypothetical protein